ncbi:MAG: 30S ribosomal protein S17 [Parcubacteria group bacterium]|nr:30S ribosomal protein S17 [Parcubacteria group bacterium]MBI2175579.1 30S ribosomal protein S17 [Parcubacteria group bacterium]
MITHLSKTEGGKQTLRGTVVSDRMDKTVIVEVVRRKKHPRYHKFVKHTRRFKAHDAENRYHAGDTVTIRESRPFSREKRWVVVGFVAKTTVAQNEEMGEKGIAA